MIVSIASGKGGTGKTTVAVNLALSLEKVQLIDCDVEEPNAHLFLSPEIVDRKSVSIKVPKINEKLCDYCGKCSEFCQYNAIAVIKGVVMIFPELCHSCGGCALICPKNALEEVDREIGIIEKGKSDGIEFVHGKLNIGEAMATPLINSVKKEIKNKGNVILDVPPGTSCPVIESVYGSDYCILVTEPTPFGLYDLKLAIGMLETLDIPHGVIVNQDGIGDTKVYGYCQSKNIPILLKIPHDRRIAELYSDGIPFTSEMHEYKDMFNDLFGKICGTP